jgi:hypothetical protein
MLIFLRHPPSESSELSELSETSELGRYLLNNTIETLYDKIEARVWHGLLFTILYIIFYL